MWGRIYHKFYKNNYQKMKKKFNEDPFHHDERRAHEYWHQIFNTIYHTISPSLIEGYISMLSHFIKLIHSPRVLPI